MLQEIPTLVSYQLWNALMEQLPRIRTLQLLPRALVFVSLSSEEPPVDISVLSAAIQTPHLTTLTLRDRFSPRNAALMKHIQPTAALTSLAVTFYPGIWDDIARFSSLNTLTISPRHTPSGISLAYPCGPERSAAAPLSEVPGGLLLLRRPGQLYARES